MLVPTTGDAVGLAAGRDALYVAQGAGGVGVIHTGPLPASDPPR